MRSTLLIALAVTLLSCSGSHEPSTLVPSTSAREELRSIASRLPPNNKQRRLIEDGRLGRGVHQAWMEAMKQQGVRAAKVEVYMTWFLGAHRLEAVRVMYFDDYDLQASQIVNEDVLSRFQTSGLEKSLKSAALAAAPQGIWLDLPAPVWQPFKAATTVTLFDNEWLPDTRNMFTTFGPGRSRFETALGQGDKVEVGRVLRTGTLTKEELTDGLYFTCAGSDTSLMSLLLKAGANPNGNPGEQNAAKYTPLMTAIQVGSAEGVQILIGAGATVNVMRDDETPLLIAVNRGTDAITSILLENKADPNVANSFGLTPLMFASHRQTSHTISSLIDHGGLVNTRDRQGRTALMFASESANLSAVQVLIERGADVSVKDSKGNTALSVAATEKVAQTIRTAGAKR